jgi:hypothetical protein
MQWTQTNSWDSFPAEQPEPRPKRARKPAPASPPPNHLPVAKQTLGGSHSLPTHLHLALFGAVLLLGAYLVGGRAQPDTSPLGIGSAVSPATVAPNAGDNIDPQSAQEYIARFAKVAQAEQERYGIPASITLAQGLLESDAGNSRLVVATNNHFGMKCFSRNCKKGHCDNFTDDTHKDFFIKFPNAWASYRAHSLFLKNTARYHRCFQQRDYQGWANELQRAGYATHPRYAEGLIQKIKTFNLDRFDR